jgi:hypothetical protein
MFGTFTYSLFQNPRRGREIPDISLTFFKNIFNLLRLVLGTFPFFHSFDFFQNPGGGGGFPAYLPLFKNIFNLLILILGKFPSFSALIHFSKIDPEEGGGGTWHVSSPRRNPWPSCCRYPLFSLHRTHEVNVCLSV